MKKLNFDSKCVKLERDLITNINNAELPIGVVVYILRTLLMTAEKQLEISCSQSEGITEKVKENNNGTE